MLLIILVIAIYIVLVSAMLTALYFLIRDAFLSSGKLPRWAAAIPVLCGIGFCFPLLGTLIPDGPVSWFFHWVGNVYLGFAMYFFGPLLLLGICALFFQRPIFGNAKPERLRAGKRCAGVIFCVLLLLSLGLNIYGSFNARKVEVTHYEVRSEKLAKERPFRIVFISDLHISVNSAPKQIREMADRINEQEADLVLVGGDLITSSFGAMRFPEVYQEILSDIHARYGIYGVYGNHDVEEPLFCGFPATDPSHAFRSQAFEDFLKSCGFHMLEDETVTIPELGDLVIAGRVDRDKAGDGTVGRVSVGELTGNVGETAPLILLEHEPDDLEELSRYGIDLCLCGHTHNGQTFPANYTARLFAPQIYGQRDWDGTQVIVSSGVGFFGPPIRVGTISEIVVIDVM